METPRKLCPGCQNLLPLTIEFFYVNQKAKNGFTSLCKTCTKIKVKKWNENHPEQYKSRVKRWHKEHTERVREIKNKWKQNNIDEVREYNRQYKREHPEQSSLTYHRRAARKRNLPDAFTVDNWLECLEYFSNCCAYCGNQQGLWNYFCVDHFIPLSAPDCPGTVIENIVPACNECNASKNDKQAELWVTEKFGKRKAIKILAHIREYFDSLKR